MGIFTKKDKFESSSNDDLLYDFFDMEEEPNKGDKNAEDHPAFTSWEDKASRIKAPHAITAEEIISDNADLPIQQIEPGASLFERVVKKAAEKQLYVPAANDMPDDSFPHVGNQLAPSQDSNNSFAQSIKMEPATPDTAHSKTSAEADDAIKSLLQKCASYIDDIDKSNDVSDMVINVPAGTAKHESVDDIISAAEQRANDRVKAKYGDINVSEELQDNAMHQSPQTTNTEKKKISVDYTVLTPGEKGTIITPSNDTAPTETIVMEPILSSGEDALDSTLVIDFTGQNDATVTGNQEKTPEESQILNEDGKTMAFSPIMDNGETVLSPQQANADKVVEDIFSNKDGHVHSISEDEFTPDEENFDETEPPVNEYTGLSDAAEIKTELLKIKKNSAVKITVSAIVAVLSLLLAVPLVSSFLGLEGAALTVFHMVLLIAVAAANIKTIVSVFGMFRGTHSFDSLASVASIAVIIHSIVTAFTSPSNTLFLTPAAAAVLMFNELGHYRKTSSIFTGFMQIASSDKKKCVLLFDNDTTAKSITGEAIEGDVLLATSGKTVNINDYIKNSYSTTPFDKNSSKILSIAIVAAVVAAIATYSLTSNISYSLAVLPLALCLAGAMPLAFSVRSLMNTLSNTVSSRCGGMVAGYRAVERFSECNAVALDAVDLFPRGSVISNDMRIISMNEVDKTLTNAVALSIKAGSPISGMLKTLLGNEIKTFPNVDSCKYENGMGISGWVDDSFMLIGNRDLMTAHNINMPSVSVDNKILRAGFFPIYISCDEKACALLIVSYHVNEHVAYDLRNSCKLGLSVFVRSTDPNINARMISDYFGVYDDFISVLNKRNIKVLDDCTKYSERCSSLASFRGSSHSLLKIINACCSIRKCITALTVVAAILACVGITTAVYSSATALFPVAAAAVVPAIQAVYWAVNGIITALNKKIH